MPATRKTKPRRAIRRAATKPPLSVEALWALKRVAVPEEIAGLISYLVREEAGYIPGASLTL